MVTASKPATNYTYQRPWMYPKQEQAFFNDCRYAYVEASTKSGKSVGLIAWLFEQAIKGKAGRNYWWVSPIIPQAKIMYRRMKRGIPSELYSANDTELRLDLPNGAAIFFKGSDNPDSLYGDDVYAVAVDEASRIREAAWYAIRSTLTATQGPARIVGNVRGRQNWFWRACRRAEAGQADRHYMKITAYDAVEAGVLAKEEIEDAKIELAAYPGVFEELYLAEASEDGTSPFGSSNINAILQPALSEKPVTAFGVDLARGKAVGADWTVIIGLDEDGQMSYYDRFQKPWRLTTQEIVRTTSGVPTLLDATGVGDAVVERVQEHHDEAEGYVYTDKSKQALMETLQLSIADREIGILDDPIIKNELEAFEFVYTRTGVRYNAPEGMHDDCVNALALAVKQWRQPVAEFLIGRA